MSDSNTYDPKSADDANTLHIYNGWGGIDFEDLTDDIERHFGTRDLSLFEIRGEKIHCRCIGYDLYDGFDYDNYLIIERKEKI